MPIITPSRRWQQAYYPFKKRSLPEKIEENIERTVKGVLWGCRMCGNCLLQETAFICPMACPKGLRNGPCGGSSPDHCCVDESRPCIWYEIYRRAENMGRLDKLLEVLPPLDWDKTGTSALRDVYEKAHEIGLLKIVSKTTHSSSEE
ncbi:MAG: methylenetetrahydrofolate reductase C-terminal domain-containing protein [Brevefilum sp.]|nr:methylenetetrahydrofolate reductase C-terminal domain-containing protein [Brevefilum sp.]MDT8380750.1 methylenetetrahydrofolate reductase C-terminal domain-containing protein [Brevefilum sp.]MDW7753663.1 methylenetetrahydrofolate reductase C-terminal domain-containing protein [Brevefilum sp.]